jgi:hypothetical protein
MAFTTICYTCHFSEEMKIILNVRVFFMKSTSIQRLGCSNLIICLTSPARVGFVEIAVLKKQTNPDLK